MIKNFFIDNLALNDLVAAPLAGVTTPPFRKLLRHFHDGIVYSEMVSVEGLRRDNKCTIRYIDRMDTGPFVLQLFGGDYNSYPYAIEKAENINPPDAYDVNMGCPVKKVVKTGGGAALLTNLKLIENIIKNIVNYTSKELSIKIRLGWDESKYVYKDILHLAEDLGVKALVVHGRTRVQMFGGSINYDRIQELVSVAKIPIIGNGDVVDYDSYLKLKNTGVSGVMIGRGMMSKPWLFKIIRERVLKSSDFQFSMYDIYIILIKLYEYMMSYADDAHKIAHYNKVIRNFAVWFSKGFDNASEFRKVIYESENMDSFIQKLDFFKRNICY